MSRTFPFSLSLRSVAIGAAVLCVPALVAQTAIAQSKDKTDEVTITVHRVKALDKIDVGGGKADFFARATIGGTVVKSAISKQQNEIKPDWKLTATVPRGKTAVKLEIMDKDVLNPSDLIDINRVAGKRDLDFTVDTRSCNVEGFSGGQSCGDRIVRAGTEKKKAEVSFRVTVKRGK